MPEAEITRALLAWVGLDAGLRMYKVDAQGRAVLSKAMPVDRFFVPGTPKIAERLGQMRSVVRTDHDLSSDRWRGKGVLVQGHQDYGAGRCEVKSRMTAHSVRSGNFWSR